MIKPLCRLGPVHLEAIRVASGKEAVREDVVERDNGRLLPTAFDPAFMALRDRKALKVDAQGFVEFADPRSVASFDDQQLHENGSGDVHGLQSSGSEVAFAFEIGRKIHRYAPVFLSDIEARQRALGKASA